jgi:Domain of Unknown Function with PDB structure (DUF3857)/Transglutaminase-like superfamily
MKRYEVAMRFSGGVTRRCLCGLVVVGWLLMALPVAAQFTAQFTAPADEELKMTSDAKAPGADAVILDREEDMDEVDEVYFVHVRIKVLTEKGKELATVRTPYDPGPFAKFEAQARTIHADGTIVPLTDAPKEMTDFKTKGYQVRSMVFNLPSVEVGSILEYWMRIRDGHWERTWAIQEHHYIHRAHFSYRPSGFWGVMTSARIGTGAAPVRNPKGFFTLDIADVPPVPEEDWMPPLNMFQWQVTFYNSEFKSSKEFWDVATKNWEKDVDDFTWPTGSVQKIAAGLVAPGDSDEQKARKIYDAVQKLDNTSFSRVKSRAERKKEKLKDVNKVEDIWKQRSGSDDAMALLYVALARAIGIGRYGIVRCYRRIRWMTSLRSFLLTGRMCRSIRGKRCAPLGRCTGSIRWLLDLSWRIRRRCFGLHRR